MGAVLLVTGGMVAHARGAPNELAEGTTAAPAGAVQAKTQLVPLSSPQAVLSRPGARGVQFLNSIILPNDPSVGLIRFNGQTKQTSLMIAGTKVQVSIADSKSFLLSYGEERCAIERDPANALTFKSVTLKLGQGRDYRLAFPYGYIFQSNSPRQIQGMLLYRGGGVQQFTVDGQAICLYDHNSDGYYRLSDDTIAVAGADEPVNVFAPLGKLFATKAGVYHLAKLAEDGSAVEYARYAGPTGTLSTAYVAPDLEARVVFASEDAGLSFVAAPKGDAPAAARAVPGSYTLHYGLVYSTALKRPVATVTAGKLPAAEVTAGQTRAIQLGGPFTLDFTVDKAGRTISIDSSKMHLRGKAGEEYASFRWKTEPEIKLVSGNKTVPVGKMKFG